MNVISLFSGCGGLDLGLERAGHTIAMQCEIDRHARSVLRRHWPDTPLHDDVTTLDPSEHRGRVDLVAGGSPCQDLSVAGRRAGLDGCRSGLFWHQCRIADSVAAPWVLWENVAGAFSSNGGADFAAVLWGLTGALPDVPDGGWRTAGVVVGPKRTAVWRLLDARWFGVAQRRRRVFVVAGPGNQCGPEVLLESEGVRGNPAPSRETGAGTASDAARGPGRGRGGRPGGGDSPGGRDVVGTITRAFGHTVGAPEVDAGLVIPVDTYNGTAAGEVTHTLRTGDESVPAVIGTLAPGAHPGVLNGQDAYTGQLIPVSVHLTQDPIHAVDSTMSLSTGSAAGAASIGVMHPPQAVRRLTPRECERLMSYPDDWTRWADTGTEIADGPRYRMCGNGVVSNVAEWIGRRLAAAEEAAR